MSSSFKKHKHIELREKLHTRFSKLKPNSKIPSARQLATSYGPGSAVSPILLDKEQTVVLKANLHLAPDWPRSIIKSLIPV